VIIVISLICISILIDIFNKKLTEDLFKKRRLHIHNHPSIIHEIVHVRIHKRFGFKKWRIIQKDDELICITTIPDEIFIPKHFPKIFLCEITHLIHDIFIRFFALEIENIIVYTKEFILFNIKIIKKILKRSELRDERKNI